MALTVAIIDDDERFRSIAARLLGLRGFEVLSSSADAASGLLDVMRVRPDAALIDYHLPDGNGVALARRLKEDGRSPAIILTSTDLDGISVEDFVGTDIRAFVPKERLASVDLEALFRELEAA